METTLIIGTKENLRKKKALKMAKELQTSKADTLLLEPESPTSAIQIAKVRELQRVFALKPYNSPCKVAIIHQVNQATLEAQNALLKLLEEPPKHTYIILTAPKAEELLPTVVSRCQIIKVSGFRFQVSGEDLKSNLQLLISIFQSRVGERLALAQEISSSRQEAIDWCRKMIITLRQVLTAKILNPKSQIPNGSTSSPSQPSRAKSRDKSQIQSSNFPIELIKKLQKALLALEKTNTNPRLLVENLLLEFPGI